VFSIIIIDQGPQILDPLAEGFGLATVSQTENPVLPQTLISVPAANYTYLPVALRASIPVTGSLEVAGGRELAFYVMNEGNFSQWRAGRPTGVVLVKPTATYYNFTLTPTVDGTYYFVFDNPNPSGSDVVFSLNTTQNTVALPPFLLFGGYEILAVGIVFLFLGVRGGKKKPKPAPPPVETPVKTAGWSCKYCGTKNNDNQIFCQSCGRSHQ
jgi:hypothetical protein